MCLPVVFLCFFFLFWFVCLLADLKKGEKGGMELAGRGGKLGRIWEEMKEEKL